MLLDKIQVHTYDRNVTAFVVLKILHVQDLILAIFALVSTINTVVKKIKFKTNNIITKDDDLANTFNECFSNQMDPSNIQESILTVIDKCKTMTML